MGSQKCYVWVVRGRTGRVDAASASELVGVAEVAARLGITAERVRQLAKVGDMPEPVGRLGRQLVWQWRDVESWARHEGRLPGAEHGGRQPVRAWRRGPVGALRLVVDEVMTWGTRPRNACHVRVWAPPAGSTEPHVVLLGELRNRAGGSVTNDVEQVAMTVARNYLGSDWRQAQFYEYRPAGSLAGEEEFIHVTFTIRDQPARARGGLAKRRRVNDLAELIGGELVEPAWRETSRDEIERLAGQAPQIWMSGTYTADLLAATATQRGDRPELVWDPDRARDLAQVAGWLHELRVGDGGALPRVLNVELGLTAKQIESAYAVVAHASLAAKERAEQDAKTQPADVAIWLNPPVLANEAFLFAAAERHPYDQMDPVEVWLLLTECRKALVTGGDPVLQPTLDGQRQLLVPGLRGGWVSLAWWEDNIEEPEAARESWAGPIALPADLVGAAQPDVALDAVELLVLLTEVLCAYLDERWAHWEDYNLPLFTPSVSLVATGPLSCAYLGAIQWRAPDTVDQVRVRRLEGVLQDIGRAGIDPDGWLVVASSDGKWFACEWPISGEPDPTLVTATIRADRPSSRGQTPVFIERRDGRLQPLPAAPDRYYGNAYAWGYAGTGPSNLASAALDLISRAAGGQQTKRQANAARQRIHELVYSPRIPNWPVEDLLGRHTQPRPRVTPQRRLTGTPR